MAPRVRYARLYLRGVALEGSMKAVNLFGQSLRDAKNGEIPALDKELRIRHEPLNLSALQAGVPQTAAIHP
jgi:hypothetical protein